MADEVPFFANLHLLLKKKFLWLLLFLRLKKPPHGYEGDQRDAGFKKHFGFKRAAETHDQKRDERISISAKA
jgi:hypothetical protein